MSRAAGAYAMPSAGASSAVAQAAALPLSADPLADEMRAHAAKEHRARRQAANKQRSEMRGLVHPAPRARQQRTPLHRSEPAAADSAAVAVATTDSPVPPPTGVAPPPMNVAPPIRPPAFMPATGLAGTRGMPHLSRAPQLPHRAAPPAAAWQTATAPAAFHDVVGLDAAEPPAPHVVPPAATDGAGATPAAAAAAAASAAAAAALLAFRSRPPFSADETGLAELQSVAAKLDSQMRISIQESLFRLAASYSSRAPEGADAALRSVRVKHEHLAPSGALPAGGASSSGMHAAQPAAGVTKWTAMIDESVATLLYHKYWEA